MYKIALFNTHDIYLYKYSTNNIKTHIEMKRTDSR